MNVCIFRFNDVISNDVGYCWNRLSGIKIVTSNTDRNCNIISIENSEGETVLNDIT